MQEIICYYWKRSLKKLTSEGSHSGRLRVAIRDRLWRLLNYWNIFILVSTKQRLAVILICSYSKNFVKFSERSPCVTQFLSSFLATNLIFNSIDCIMNILLEIPWSSKNSYPQELSEIVVSIWNSLNMKKLYLRNQPNIEFSYKVMQRYDGCTVTIYLVLTKHASLLWQAFTIRYFFSENYLNICHLPVLGKETLIWMSDIVLNTLLT